VNKEKSFRTKILRKVTSKMLSSHLATFFFDPIIPKIISFYLSQSLNKWKHSGILESYDVEVQRISKLYYYVGLHVLAKKKETRKVLVDYVSKLLDSFVADLV
jgi:hypothetical protein